jgi:hypothetical protein
MTKRPNKNKVDLLITGTDLAISNQTLSIDTDHSPLATIGCHHVFNLIIS